MTSFAHTPSDCPQKLAFDKIGMDIPETVDEWGNDAQKIQNELNVETPTCTSAAFGGRIYKRCV